jgi:hypothetical protein
MAVELREGKALSASTMDTLSQVLELIASADDAVDQAQPLLADLMGVPNPDDPAEDESLHEQDAEAERAAVALMDRLKRQHELERESRTPRLVIGL